MIYNAVRKQLIRYSHEQSGIQINKNLSLNKQKLKEANKNQRNKLVFKRSRYYAS